MMKNKIEKPIKNAIYLTFAAISLLVYLNIFYNFFNDDVFYKYLIVRIIFIFWLFYYLMGLTFTILIHPIIILVKLLLKKYGKDKVKKYIVFFIWSIIIAIVYIYFIYGKGFIITV
jgi:hypothetical protein